jgi:hypothetical protein
VINFSSYGPTDSSAGVAFCDPLQEIVGPSFLLGVPIALILHRFMEPNPSFQ